MSGDGFDVFSPADEDGSGGATVAGCGCLIVLAVLGGAVVRLLAEVLFWVASLT